MQPATGNATYKGAVLVNPGGPGGSGTQMVAEIGTNLTELVGEGYDVIGFDPRGTGATLPLAQCFETESELQTFAQRTPVLVNASDDSIPYSKAQDDAVAQLCQRKLGGNGSENANGTVEEWGGGRFMDTASVATDMLRIIEKLGQDKLHYFGVSYGTILGQYFASLYPEKVGRFVIDAVCDAEYYPWNSALVETEGVIDGLYSYCHLAGPAKCPLYESSIAKIKARVWNIMKTKTPLAVPFAAQGPAVVTEALLQQQILNAVYFPISGWPEFANILVAVETNNQSVLAASDFVAAAAPACNSTNEPAPWQRTNSAEYAIACSDYPLADDPAAFDAYLREMTKESPIAAPGWVGSYLACMKWRIKAKKRYTGPFAGNTSSPIFVLSNVLDPVCPLTHARRVHARFPGAGLLVQNATGHVATLTPSACTVAAVQAYFANGTLPAAGAVCQPNVLPFVGAVGGD
ncbi:hypothetical protein PLICRDRAFT_350772 [Plicaturopsis crispa FD-325 SS-3]|uniref:Unplaced genomic scaffold PLICRscaffold_165, whole genome shotgun sequence n=1 Tax=Plicaturopsis crispa FD-325 SS-3 TaxID=944288 RepID=A0A0C9SV24_PLICR|nr:hypothetical protein PLICRDRAFT_350772 [Plicaturopsis crispa FD-325 SS-3]